MFVGDCGLTWQPVEGEQLLELGYHLDEQHRGAGCAPDAGRTCIEHAFAVTDVDLVCSIVAPENGPSIAVSSRLHPHRRTFPGKRGLPRLLFWTDRAAAAPS
jgi:RimJ/RimL family protein N-acetyltransferase